MFIKTNMTKQIICRMVKNLIILGKIQSWTLDLEGIHLEAIASNSDKKKALIPFVFKIWQSVGFVIMPHLEAIPFDEKNYTLFVFKFMTKVLSAC